MEVRDSITGSGKRANSVSWADLQHLGSQEARGSSWAGAGDALLGPISAASADRARQGTAQGPAAAFVRRQVSFSSIRRPSLGPIRRGVSNDF